MQSLENERAKKEYEQFVKEVTPKQNLFCNMAKAFIVCLLYTSPSPRDTR